VRKHVSEGDTSPDVISTKHAKAENEALVLSATTSRKDSTYESVRPPAQKSEGHNVPSTAPEKAQKRPKDKKKSGVLGFLTLKEPSASAWEEFAEQQRKGAAQKGGKTFTVDVSGVSSQRLPEFVPKTNSAWDGLPDNAADTRNRSKRSSVASRARRHSGRSVASTSSRSSGEFSRDGSLSNRAPRTRTATTMSQTERRSGMSNTSSRGPRGPTCQTPTPTASTIASTATRDYAVTPWDEPEKPQRPRRVEEEAKHPETSPKTFLLPPSPPLLPPSLTLLLPSSELDLPAMTRLEDHDTASVAHTSPDASPQTPSVDERPHVFPNIEEQHGPDSVPSSLDGPAFPYCSGNDAENLHAKTSALTIRNTHLNFSRPRLVHKAPSSHEKRLPPTIEEADEEEKPLATLRDETGRTSPFLFDFNEAALAGDRTGSPHSRASSQASSSTVPARTSSTSSRLTAVTASSATTAAPSVHSPAASTLTFDSAPPSNTTARDRQSSTSSERSNSDAGSIAPSVMSVQWTMSSKERLGLGGRVVRREKVDVLPWEEDGNAHRASSWSTTPVVASGAAGSKRYSMANSAASSGLEAGKLKRLSMRLGRR